MRERSDVVAIVVGDSKVSRGLDIAFHGRDYREHALQSDPSPDPDRLWFLGKVEPWMVADVLAVSDLHVYPSRTFPASRSLVEAMASGKVILASDDSPVREVIRAGVDGLLAAPDDADAWIRLANEVLDDPSGHSTLGAFGEGRVSLKHFRPRTSTLPRLAERLNELAGTGRFDLSCACSFSMMPFPPSLAMSLSN